MNRNSVIVFAFGLLLRLWLIHAFPIVFGGDTILHLINRDHLVLSHQLPLLQVLIYLMSRMTEHLWPMRAMLAVIGAVSGVAFLALARQFVDERAAFGAALLFTSNPFLVELSIVPFQEILMLGLLLLSFHLYFREKLVGASASFALACLTRYEAWIAAPFLVLFRKPWIKTALLFGWMPVAWVAMQRGLSPSGSFVIEWPHSPERLVRWVYLAWITVRGTPAPVLLLAVIGAWRMRFSDRRLMLLAAFLAAFLIATLFSAHGEQRNPERLISSREATLLVTAVAFAAAYGFAKAGRAAVWLTAIGLIWSVADAHRVLARDTSDAHMQLSYQVAQYLDAHVKPGEQVRIVAASAVQSREVQSYLDKVRDREGEGGVARAREMMAGVEMPPVDCARTIVQSNMGRAQISCVASKQDWLVVWSDVSEKPLRPPTEILRSGSVAVYLYHP